MAASYKAIVVEKEGAMDVLTLNRPESLNSIDRVMVEELQHYFSALRNDYHTRVVLLRGAGRGFCPGVDLSCQEWGIVTDGTKINFQLSGQMKFSHLFKTMRAAPQIIISLIHGPCCGDGLALALASDVRLVTPEAKISAAMIKMGLTGGDVGISYGLPRSCGTGVAAEWMMTGRFVNGQRAVETNLASELFETQEKMEAGARALAEEMLKGDPNGLRLTKDCLQSAVDAPSFEAAVALEDRQQVLTVIGGEWGKRVADFGKAKPAASKL